MEEFFLELLFVSFLFSFVWMFAGWLGYVKYKNATIVDVAWTFGILGVTILYFVLGKVPYGSKYIILFAMFIWALRLGTLIIYRIIRFGVDGRYKALDKSFEVNPNRKYFFFFMFQGASLLIFTLPVLILVSSDKIYRLWSLMATGVILIALLGVILSDIQLQRFLAKGENKGKVCQNGLWNYSRHPNYFFEWIYWCALALFVYPLPYGSIALVCPIGLLLTLFFVTGIPPTEKQALLSKKEAYIEYQRTTSVFVPWFKKK